jgi:solute carrier family 25 protein 33/36
MFVMHLLPSGIATSICTSPLWMIKTRMQLQANNQDRTYKNSLDCLVKVVKGEGVFSLYRGLSASLIGMYFIQPILPLQ